MILHRRHIWFLLICLLPALAFTPACSSRGNKNSVTNTNDTDTLGDDDLLGGGGSTSTPSSTVPNINTNTGNLFQTDLDDDERPSGSEWTNYGQPSQQQQSCLANGFNTYGQEFDEDYYGARNNASYTNQYQSQNACVSPGQSGAQGYMPREDLLNMGVGTYANMNYCLELVLSYQPTAQTAEIAHRAGAMALTRCYMRISQQLAQSANWGQPQQQVFGTQNQNLRVLLLLLATDR